MILARHVVGLDPTLGIFHTDQCDRVSLASDMMEAGRPTVDACLLALLTQRTFARRDFAETRQVARRLSQHLAVILADTCVAWRREFAPIAERVAHVLVKQSPARLPHLTPLTRSSWKAAWDDRNPQRAPRQPWTNGLTLPNTCRDRGGELATRRHRYCDSCRARRWKDTAPRGHENADRALSTLRAEHRDPARGGRAGELRGAKNAAHQRAVGAWRRERPEPTSFSAEILPALRGVPIASIAAARGLSADYCSPDPPREARSASALGASDSGGGVCHDRQRTGGAQ